jgi:hypothetical protein
VEDVMIEQVRAIVPGAAAASEITRLNPAMPLIRPPLLGDDQMRAPDRRVASRKLRTSVVCHAMLAAALTLTLFTPAFSQTAPPVTETVRLSGPRFGVTFLSDSVVRKLRESRSIDVGSLVTQFGWQFEKRFSSSDNGLTPVTEWVLLLGGLEQGVVLPSLSWLVGLRARDGVEFGVGPNFTPVGVSLAIAGGVTFRSGTLNFPVNLAVVPSRVSFTSYSGPPSYTINQVRKTGIRVSLLLGFNMRRR